MNLDAKRLAVTMAALFVLALSGPAPAAVVGTSTGVFVNPTGPAGMTTTGVGTSNFSWGVGSPPPSSSLSFTGTAVNTPFDTPFSFGTLSYYNGTTLAGTEANSVDLRVNLTLTSPTGVNQNFDYLLGLINSPNDGDANHNADYVLFPSTLPSTSFSTGGRDYTLAFLGFGSLSGGGFLAVNEFHVLENCRASAQLIGEITDVTQPVPEPGTILLLGCGLAGLACYGKKRTRKQS